MAFSGSQKTRLSVIGIPGVAQAFSAKIPAVSPLVDTIELSTPITKTISLSTPVTKSKSLATPITKTVELDTEVF